MGYWRRPGLLSLLLLSFSCSAGARRSLKTNLCKWCDSTLPACEEKVCYSNCNLNSYCEDPYEICVAIWRQDNESIRISTLCHNPHRPIENLMVPNYNTSRCIMTHQPSEDGITYICGCVDEQECNDKLIFENHTNGYSMLQSKEVIPVAAISLLPPLLVAVMITVIFYLCRTQKRRKRAKAWGSRHVLSWMDLQKMAGSLVSGVAHLHSDYTACGRPKIPIAHRDIKSTNVLVKNEQECVLCDFGIAIRLDPSLTVDDFANSGQVGTARYMAPEVLESRVNLEDLESFKQMDVYSMALVLWEMASRCEVVGEVKNYELPFGSKVQEQPCVDTMRDIVLHGRGRPEIPSSWLVHQGMRFLCDTITECWDHDPEARLTAHCVAERFNLMAQMDCDDILNNNTDNEASKTASPGGEHQDSDGNRNMQ
ncbi:PREDICTED: TGF-beta receptor type-2-like [Pygoscelis adeliae]|uniref:TGF-beta receptor type-2-like n=1 Tax=Pygoscelis adeliae TaxID=9238 RepID=UPI0004F5070E|nr:PREDICTED: TGF-beta receptor type-2-like [Pygoscelis adeliae]